MPLAGWYTFASRTSFLIVPAFEGCYLTTMVFGRVAPEANDADCFAGEPRFYLPAVDSSLTWSGTRDSSFILSATTLDYWDILPMFLKPEDSSFFGKFLIFFLNLFTNSSVSASCYFVFREVSAIRWFRFADYFTTRSGLWSSLASGSFFWLERSVRAWPFFLVLSYSEALGNWYFSFLFYSLILFDSANFTLFLSITGLKWFASLKRFSDSITLSSFLFLIRIIIFL